MSVPTTEPAAGVGVGVGAGVGAGTGSTTVGWAVVVTSAVSGLAEPPPHPERARAVAGYLQGVGIKCKMEIKETGAAYADMLERKMTPIFHWNWGNWSLLDIDGTLQFVFGCTKPGQGRWSYYCNPRIEEIIEGLKTVDEQKRRALSKEAMEILHEEAPVVYLYEHYDIHAKRTGIPDFKARSDNTIRLKWVKGE